MNQYQVTGNEYVSLPTIRESDGAVEGITCLYMGVKGMLELKGREAFMQPFLCRDGQRRPLKPAWERSHCWIPAFTSETEEALFCCVYLTPVGERGFALRLEVTSHATEKGRWTIGLEGAWDETLHTVNESIPLETGRTVKRSGWNQMFVFQQVPGLPLIAFAPIVGDYHPFTGFDDQGAEWQQEGFTWKIEKTLELEPGQSMRLDVFFGLGYEEVAAATSAKEQLRQSFDTLLRRTETWLASREKHVPDAVVEKLLNTNLFFSFFYASGRTIDTEELCLMTSRSPRYYVSAAYWDRDSLLWAFPAMVEADAGYAREVLMAVFHRQSRNFGVHSRYIDGTVLEPGFELDELCAPVIALERYMQKTGDESVLRAETVQEGLRTVLARLELCKHPQVELYGTFLQPTDDPILYPWLTYDNVLVWRSLRALGRWLNQPALEEKAEKVRQAIWQHCTVQREGKRIFAWAVDLEGNHQVYDEPPGSLQLLPFFGFCGLDDPVWRDTVALIRSEDYELSFAGHAIAEIGCKHAPHPWVLSICNSLLSGNAVSALQHLRLTRMDNGIACESVHEDTGACTTGAAFATCAGFLAYALCQALEKA